MVKKSDKTEQQKPFELGLKFSATFERRPSAKKDHELTHAAAFSKPIRYVRKNSQKKIAPAASASVEKEESAPVPEATAEDQAGGSDKKKLPAPSV